MLVWHPQISLYIYIFVIIIFIWYQCTFLSNWNEDSRISLGVTYFLIALESHVELDCALPWLDILLPVEHEYLMLGKWCNWYFEETSLLSADAFSSWSGSDYRGDTRFRVDTETGCACTQTQTHGNNYSVWGIGSPVFVSLCLSLPVFLVILSLFEVVVCQ